jgi:hypothetical protein
MYFDNGFATYRMAKERFEAHRFRKRSQDLIARVEQIFNHYESLGYLLTLRQTFYQFVSRNWLGNSERAYKNLGDLIGNARKAGLLDWDRMEDRSRGTISPVTWTDPAEVVRGCLGAFQIDRWADQPYRIEVLCEKQALEGVLTPTCEELQIAMTCLKGYSSHSIFYEMGRRLARWRAADKAITVLYAGDHDPSGIDMGRDVRERLSMYTRFPVDVVRIGLNMDQIARYNPPPNPAKETDARYAAYVLEHGPYCWEMDSLEPTLWDGLVRQQVLKRRDAALWSKALEKEEAMRQELQTFADSYGKAA